MRTKPIVIVGGGFAGVRAALALDKIYGNDLESPIFLIDNAPYHLYTPSLFEIASADIPRVAAIPYEQIFTGTGVKFIQEKVTHIDLELKHVITEHRKLVYEDLVIAVGSQRKSFNGKKSNDSMSFGYKTVDDVLAIRDHIADCFKNIPESSRQKYHNHFIVVGGGPAGVEFASGLRHFVQFEAKKYGFSPSGIKISLVEAGPRLLSAFSTKLSQKTRTYLTEQGVKVVTKTLLQPKGKGTMVMGTESCPMQTIFWTIGVMPNALLGTIKGLRHDEHGHILVDSSLQAVGAPNVWVAGDSAAVPDSGLAWSAIAQGEHVAKSIQAIRELSVAPAYHITTWPIIVPLGRMYGVAQFGKKVVEGYRVILYKRWLDLRYFLSILPIPVALSFWFSHGRVIKNAEKHEYIPFPVKGG